MDSELSPGQEGSDAALQILHLLVKTKDAGGCSLADVCGLLNLQKVTAQAAMKGLYLRGRIKSEGHGMAARWRVV